MNNQQETTNNKLSNIKLVFGVMDEYEDCTYCHAIVYSYLLCKYSWFKSQGKQLFESQEKIAESCRSKYGSVRGSVRWLLAKGLITVGKVHSGLHNKNVYTVDDRYGAYTDMQKKVVPVQSKVLKKFDRPIEDDDEGLPF